jgi:hypothetical protein
VSVHVVNIEGWGILIALVIWSVAIGLLGMLMGFIGGYELGLGRRLRERRRLRASRETDDD